MSFTAPVRRRRGRPRRDEVREANPNDLRLIQEFKQRPALYDREHPHYRKLEFLEPLWEQIGYAVGIDSNEAKERMTSLRSRFNIEKRRVEILRGERDDMDLESNWPLYNELRFLEYHVRSRLKRESLSDSLAAEIETDTFSNDVSTMVHSVMENAKNMSSIRTPSTPQIISARSETPGHGFEQPRKMRNQPSSSRESLSSNVNAAAAAEKKSQRQMQVRVPLPLPLPLPVTVQSETAISKSAKFQHFGNFLASSLMDMEENVAFATISKITKDICEALKECPNQHDSSDSNHINGINNHDDDQYNLNGKD